MWSGEVALLVIAAVAVGAAIPLLVQATLALRAVRSAVQRGDRALAAIAASAERLERLTAPLEEKGRVESFLAAVESLAGAVHQLRDTIRVGSAVGAALAPAVGAAVRAWRARPDGARGAEEGTSANPEGFMTEHGGEEVKP